MNRMTGINAWAVVGGVQDVPHLFKMIFSS